MNNDANNIIDTLVKSNLMPVRLFLYIQSFLFLLRNDVWRLNDEILDLYHFENILVNYEILWSMFQKK